MGSYECFDSHSNTVKNVSKTNVSALGTQIVIVYSREKVMSIDLSKTSSFSEFPWGIYSVLEGSNPPLQNRLEIQN